MCAINGFNFKDENLIIKMNQATKHRGPDGTGFFVSDGISLGHNRLSIIDLSENAKQPMESFDGKHAIVFNGEIYNFKEIKKEITDYQFKSKSDTEVILAAYKKWGKDCVKKFNGIFAFAIWDKAKKELFLARDHIGVKPLYYFWDGKRFIFSSEIKAILEHDIARVLNKEAFNHYLRVLYVPEPLTMFDHIYKFPAASYGILKGNEFKIEKYWDIEIGKYFDFSEKELEENLRQKIKESVSRQLISDRPLGVYLSGGIDSSIVLHAMSEERSNIDTFSVGFELNDEKEREKFNADFYLARKTAKHYATNHNEVFIAIKDAISLLEKSIWHLDEPISNATSIPMMKLAEFAKQKADVVLGGDGGDEIFGGYERYRLSFAASAFQKTPEFLRRLVLFSDKAKKLNTPPDVERFSLFMFQKDSILESVLNEKYLDKKITADFFNNKYLKEKNFKIFEELFMDTDRRTWLVDESLMMTDKMSMSFGLEARVPILDKDLVEFSSQIPANKKIGLFDKKIILKNAFKGRIPEYLFNQPKRGWFSPAAKWLRDEEFYKTVREAFSQEFYKETADVFNLEEMQKILDRHYQKKEYNLNIIWSVLVFQIWTKLYRVKIR